MNVADEFSADVLDIITDFGGPATIKRIMKAGSVDKFDRTKRQPPVYLTINTVAAMKPVNTEDVDGSLSSDTIVYMAETPREGEAVTYAGSNYIVQSVKTYAPQGVAIFSIVVLKG